MTGWLARLWRSPPPSVDLATLRDIAALSQLHGAAFHRGWGVDEFEQILLDRNTLAHRMRIGRKLIGFAVSRIVLDEAEILSVAIAKACQGRGYSRGLLQTHMGQLAGRGVRIVFLEVEENNAPARRLYAREGFAVVGQRERYYRAPGGVELNALVMQRDLS